MIYGVFDACVKRDLLASGSILVGEWQCFLKEELTQKCIILPLFSDLHDFNDAFFFSGALQ